MEQYDAILENEYRPEAPRMSKEEWAEMKRQERSEVFATLDRMADQALADPNMLSAYLSLQARLGRSSLSNTLLVLAQKPDATFVCDAKAWQDRGRGIRKGEGKNAIRQLQQDQEYRRSDGSMVMGYKVVRCFDVSQTYGRPTHQRATLAMPLKDKLKALMTDAPVRVKLSDTMSQSIGAAYSEAEQAIHVARGMDGAKMFYCVARELARAEGCTNLFLNDCAANITCVRFGVEPRLADRIPEDIVSLSTKEKKAALAQVRECAGEVVSRVERNLYEMRQQQKNQPER